VEDGAPVGSCIPSSTGTGIRLFHDFFLTTYLLSYGRKGRIIVVVVVVVVVVVALSYRPPSGVLTC
jgi:hypothetical protein